VRLFIAVSPDQACRARLAQDLAPLLAEPGVRWVRPEQLHITLAFLGEVDAARREGIVAAVTPVVARHRAFEGRLAGSGAFPNWQRPRVIWLGFNPPEALLALGTDVQRTCAAIGFPMDRAFRPHLTIGRMQSVPAAAARAHVRDAVARIGGPYPFPVSRVELVHSVLGSGGSRHTVIHEFPLGGA